MFSLPRPIQYRQLTFASINRHAYASRILVVEDEELLRFMICEVLRDGGLEVVEVANADAALVYLNTTDNIDLVFTDVNMPGSMDGIGLAHAVNDNFPEVKVMVTSGKATSDAVAPNLFIPKPYRPFDLLDMMKAAL